MQTNTEAPAELPTAHRVAVLSRDDRLYHLILAQQIDRELIEQLCRLAEMIRSGQIKNIDIGLVDDPENPIVLNLTTGREMKVTGSTDRQS